MRGLTDGRFSIRAEATVETEDLRELTGNRHRQDSEGHGMPVLGTPSFQILSYGDLWA